MNSQSDVTAMNELAQYEHWHRQYMQLGIEHSSENQHYTKDMLLLLGECCVHFNKHVDPVIVRDHPEMLRSVTTEEPVCFRAVHFGACI